MEKETRKGKKERIILKKERRIALKRERSKVHIKEDGKEGEDEK